MHSLSKVRGQHLLSPGHIINIQFKEPSHSQGLKETFLLVFLSRGLLGG